MTPLDIRCHRLLVAGLFAGLCMAGIAVADEPTNATSPAIAAPADLPEAKTVLENALKAMGGREALDGVKSSMVKATIRNTPMGDMSLETYYATPNRFLLKQIVPGMGEMSMGSDGETAWVLNPMVGYQLLNPDDVEGMRDQASMHNFVMRLEKEFSDLKTVDRTAFQEQDCFKVRMIDNDGQEQFAFFNAENHFIAGLEIKQQTLRGLSTTSMRFEEWKTFGDIKIFTRMIVNEQGQGDMTLEMTEIELDKVDKAVFTLPAEVKRMADERRATEQPEDDASEESPS